MRKLVTSRAFRCVLCLILVCCMIVNCLAIKAEALTLGGTALALLGDDAIALIAACLAGLGVMAKLETEMDTLTFRHLCEDAYDAMAAAGEWVVDGAVTVYNCATELWDYGVDCGMVQWLHDWLWNSDSPVLIDPTSIFPANAAAQLNAFIAQYCSEFGVSECYTYIMQSQDGSATIYLARYPLVLDGGYYYSYNGTTKTKMWRLNWTGLDFLTKNDGSVSFAWPGYSESYFLGTIPVYSPFDISLGQVALPGTEIEVGYEEWADIGQIIIVPGGLPETGGDPGDDDPVQIPLLPIPVGPDYDTIIQTPQEDIWKGNKVETEDPDTGGSTDPSTGTDTDDPDSGSNDPTTPTSGTDNPDSPGDDGSQDVPLTPDQLQPYVFDLRDFFPFCIPFDLFDFFQLLDADPVAPVFHWEIQDLAGNVYSIDIDLSAWDSTALFFRRLQLLVFTVGLAMASRKFIKW